MVHERDRRDQHAHALILGLILDPVIVEPRCHNTDEVGDGLDEGRGFDVENVRQYLPRAAVLEHDQHHEHDVLAGELWLSATSDVPVSGDVAAHGHPQRVHLARREVCETHDCISVPICHKAVVDWALGVPEFRVLGGRVGTHRVPGDGHCRVRVALAAHTGGDRVVRGISIVWEFSWLFGGNFKATTSQ
ncbi:unnamed protein product [Phytophthora fragariaefolia]|uniref:Unnamed protein product n=1 Tax=Phytophthora fragariaefolia TaxID=1490495 RepID=A0A9W7CSA3_9STRA|nr:unnamed protein product [Phytophthora fragariaefolia]